MTDMETLAEVIRITEMYLDGAITDTEMVHKVVELLYGQGRLKHE